MQKRARQHYSDPLYYAYSKSRLCSDDNCEHLEKIYQSILVLKAAEYLFVLVPRLTHLVQQQFQTYVILFTDFCFGC